MKCNHVLELLPLYVGGDLEEKRAKLITAHVQACAECAGSADEYRETRQLVQQFAPPPFSEAVYTVIRQRVLREVGRESISPTLPQLVASWFRLRITWAVAPALLMAVSVLAFYFIADRTDDQQPWANIPGSVDGAKQDEHPNMRFKKDYLETPLRPDLNGTVGAPPAWATRLPKSRLSLIAQKVRHSSRAKASFADSSADPTELFLSTPTTSEKTLRVEMQTKDPNIRVIWFAIEKTKRDSPSGPSKSF